MMSPINPPHASVVSLLAATFIQQLQDRATVAIQSPIAINADSEPQPDIIIAKPSPTAYRDRHITPQDTLLLIEVADTSAAYDLSVKASLYASANICEYWVFDLEAKQLVRHQRPQPSGTWSTIERLDPSQSLGLQAFPELAIKLQPLLDPSNKPNNNSNEPIK